MRFPYGSRRLWVPTMAAFILVLLPIPLAGAAAPQAGVSWDYRLIGSVNQATDGLRTIVLTGKGSFNTDPSAPSIDGGGGYTILNTDGSVFGSGTWTATDFDSFDESTGPGGSPGEGGRLQLEASFDGTGVPNGSALADVVIQCSMWGEETVGPPGFPWPGDFVTVDFGDDPSYTTPVSGAVMFNLDQ